LKCNTGGSISEGFEGSQELDICEACCCRGGGKPGDRPRAKREVGFAGQVTTEAADGILDAAFLPRVGLFKEAQTAGHLLGRPALFQIATDLSAELG
jgi:hypothetical protein